MTQVFTISFAPLDAKPKPASVIFTDDNKKMSKAASALDPKDTILARAMNVAGFTGKAKTSFDVLAPAGSKGIDRIIGIGAGDASADYDSNDWITLGGYTAGRLQILKVEDTSLIADVPGITKKQSGQLAADLAMGILLRGYKYDAFKTRSSDDDDDSTNGSDDKSSKTVAVTIHCPDPKAAEAAFARTGAIADGVCLARDLVNAPANILGPAEFADRAKELEALGVEVNILDERAMEAYGMHSFLSVGRGSRKPCRMVVMNWWGSKSKRSAPVAFVGKGVTFDTGGISLKPPKGMEDMKGDMGGAACVTGLMHALASRKAPINVVGIIGLVENMPGSNATRPGDIVTSASGQTIEIINTDAEGRLVLADCLWYAEKEVNPRPKIIIDLATLTGAILVALGQEYAGMFSNDDKLADMLSDAGEATSELVWRMPMSKKFDAMINSRNADMKNTGGRYGGSTTAAQFLKRFITDTPWAHLDIAGTAMSSPKSDINQSWGSGYGVRLLNELVEANYEK